MLTYFPLLYFISRNLNIIPPVNKSFVLFSVMDSCEKNCFSDIGMDSFKTGWFSDIATLTDGVIMSVKAKKILYHEKSKYQDILIFDTERWGRVLILDGCYQMSELDEFVMQEMAAFVPLNSHPSPKKVLIIGGGVGGLVRECSKHPLVETIDICEIDEKVHEASKKYLPFMYKGFESKKYNLYFDDGAEFVKRHANEYDVIITDSPDPKGVGACLFENSYYLSVKKALRPGGILISQGETFWYDLEMMSDMIKMCQGLFPVVDYLMTYIVSFPAGQIGYLCCSDNPETNFREPLHKFSRQTLKEFKLKYYTPDVHRAAFALPFKKAQALGLKQRGSNIVSCPALGRSSAGMDLFEKGWFSEIGTLHQDIVMSVKVKKVLYQEKSKYQDILIFDSERWGRVLVLDDCVQLSEFDEFVWQETASFVSLNSHPNPKKILLIGGGVGGILRECSKHPLVETIDICEIDEKVHEASKKYLPFMYKGFESKKYNLYFGDGAEFVKQHVNEYDVILTDSPDPKGVAACLFENSYYVSLKKALKPGGILLSQGETLWYDLYMMTQMIQLCKGLFPVVDYATTYHATYPAGQIGYLCCSDNPNTNFRKPIHKFSRKTLKDLKLKYYTPDVHRAVFAKPFKMAAALGLNWEAK